MEPVSRARLSERLELAASLAWLGMDYAWMEEQPTSALTLAVLTCAGSLAAALSEEARFTPRAVAGAMAAWALMNSLWMADDLGVYAGLWLARLCFYVGLGLLVAAVLRDRSASELVRELSRRFRRLRMRRRGGQP
jgi:hypothetical protein